MSHGGNCRFVIDDCRLAECKIRKNETGSNEDRSKISAECGPARPRGGLVSRRLKNGNIKMTIQKEKRGGVPSAPAMSRV
jgi:hypothetical protein